MPNRQGKRGGRRRLMRGRARLVKLLASGMSQAKFAAILAVSAWTVGQSIARMKRALTNSSVSAVTDNHR